MTDAIEDDLYIEGQLLTLLCNKKYKDLVHLIDEEYGRQFRAEKSGETFEDCVDWCAQNAGGLENAKQVLSELFKKFYGQLPAQVRDNLAYLAEEIGYSPQYFHRLSLLRESSKDRVGATKTSFNVMVKQVLDYMTEIRQRREPHVSVRFYQPAAAGMMQRGERLKVDEQAAKHSRQA
jgi:hypothetical protein